MNLEPGWKLDNNSAIPTMNGLEHPNSDRIEVNIHTSLGPLEREWRAFERVATGTFYQTFDWCNAWIETAGRTNETEPRVIAGRDPNGSLIFLLPLAIRKAATVRLLEWIGSRQITYGYGLYDRDFLPNARHWFVEQDWLPSSLRTEIDAIWLKELPGSLHGWPHPLGSWFSLTSANKSYAMKLNPNYDELYAEKRSSDTRRGNRKRDAKLDASGHTSFGLPSNLRECHQILEEMFAQQERRLSEQGIRGVFNSIERAFVHRLADCGGALLPYHLKIDGQLAAMMLGGKYDGTYWALISSLGKGELRKYSPGDAALRRTIEACCKEGLCAFDFSSGDSPYKQHWADEVILLHEVIRFVSLKGAIWALATVVYAFGKRKIKQSSSLWNVFTSLRAAIWGERLERQA